VDQQHSTSLDLNLKNGGLKRDVVVKVIRHPCELVKLVKL